MRSGLWVATFVAVLVLVACGGNGNGGSNGNGEPGTFEEHREALALRLESIGVNIGAVPDDVRRALLRNCRALGQDADKGDVEDICSSVDDAIDSGDPGLIDHVVGRLRALKAD